MEGQDQAQAVLRVGLEVQLQRIHEEAPVAPAKLAQQLQSLSQDRHPVTSRCVHMCLQSGLSAQTQPALPWSALHGIPAQGE